MIFDLLQHCFCQLFRKKNGVIQKWKDNINDISTDNKGQGSVKANIHYFWRFDLISGPETHALSPWTQKTVVTARLWLGFSSQGNCFSVNFWGEQIRGLVFCCILWPYTHLLKYPPFYTEHSLYCSLLTRAPLTLFVSKMDIQNIMFLSRGSFFKFSIYV